MGETVGVVLAAGKGKRMLSTVPKVLHRVGGRPMVAWVVGALTEAGVHRTVVVVGEQVEAVRAALGDGVGYIRQDAPLGTGDALLRVRPVVRDDDDLLVVCGDTPLLTGEVLTGLLAAHREGGAAATLLAVRMEDPRGYGRIVRDQDGRLLRIVEESDAGPGERAIQEVNTGVYALRAGPVLAALGRVRPDNIQGECYLVDVFPLLLSEGAKVQVVVADDPTPFLGVNSRAELAAAEEALQHRVVERLWLGGVTVASPATSFISPTARVGRDTWIGPMTVIEGDTVIGERCRIGPGTYLRDARLADEVEVWYSVVEESTIESGASIGPFAHLRPGCHVEGGVQVGNFAEVKNSHIGRGSKVHHHSYIGDADIGAGVNIGAGVVTVNYDGRNKHRTQIEAGAFVGCNVNLVAPLRVGRRAYVAAGSTLTEDVPAGALAIARSRQVNKEGWTARRFPEEGEDRG
ncbi:MAG: bifunctional UDP-N-acetylglucosamine diphosphorylase/glucosamine-1-phosphate N-acetyltransferase GlmU, partial [Clostridia bacterium]|nr:bifunctional UDP-N-acetylglucosamine diphosphorylase/glucosamine-1-phosphate N-acetyltransferase GlmU [Clostridia bacterium]